MPIEHKFGVPISALGRMAYAVGAGEAAKKRALEDRERRMQMMRMQQQQQEAARGRQFDAWKNQYQHGSAMQRMQADHEWKAILPRADIGTPNLCSIGMNYLLFSWINVLSG